jgi:hypothetical protein
MDEERTGQEPSARGQVPQPPQPEPAPAGAQAGQEPEPERFDADYVKKLRSEAAEYRRRMRELEQIVRQHEDAKLSETERLQKRLAELEREQELSKRERQERTLKYETMLAASRLGIVDPEAAYRLLDLTTLTFAEDGTPTNLEQVLHDLLKAKPYLAKQPQVSAGSPTNPATGQQRGGVFTTSQLTDYRFWQQHRDEILRAMAEGRIVSG